MKDLFAKMKKLIHLTEAQYNRLIEDGSYIDDKDNVHPYSSSKTYITSPISGDDDVEEFGEQPITDKISSHMVTQYPRGVTPFALGKSNRIYAESNQDLTGKQNTFQLSDENMKKLSKRLGNYQGPNNVAGIKRGQNMIQNQRISYDDAYRILDDMKNGKAGNVLDPDGAIQAEIENKIKTGENISKSSRETKKKMGQNVIKSAPKDGRKGGAHKPKNMSSNVFDINYFN